MAAQGRSCGEPGAGSYAEQQGMAQQSPGTRELGPVPQWLWQHGWEQPQPLHSQAEARMLHTSVSQVATFLLPLKIFMRILECHSTGAHATLSQEVRIIKEPQNSPVKEELPQW